MPSKTNASRRFKRTEWQPGMLSSVLSNLVDVLQATDVHVRFNGMQTEQTAPATDDGPDAVHDVTSLPVGQRVLIAQYSRERGDSADVSNVDILTVDMLSVNVVSVIFDATTPEYQISVQAGNSDMAGAALALLKERLSLHEIP